MTQVVPTRGASDRQQAGAGLRLEAAAQRGEVDLFGHRLRIPRLRGIADRVDGPVRTGRGPGEQGDQHGHGKPEPFFHRRYSRRSCRDSKTIPLDRKSVVSGKSVSVRVDLGGRRILKKKKKK